MGNQYLAEGCTFICDVETDAHTYRDSTRSRMGCTAVVTDLILRFTKTIYFDAGHSLCGRCTRMLAGSFSRSTPTSTFVGRYEAMLCFFYPGLSKNGREA